MSHRFSHARLEGNVHTQVLYLNILLFLVGLLLLVKGSAWFIDGAAYVAHRFQISDAIIGLTLVSVGTSLPELATNVYAATIGEGAVAIGNVVGSNVANVLLILGVAIVALKRIDITHVLLRRDVLVMMGVFVVFGGFCFGFPIANPVIGRWEALCLLAIVVAYIWYLMRVKSADIVAQSEPASDFIKSMPIALLILAGGGIFTALGAAIMVDNVVWAARVRFQIPEELVSATVVAFGTSIPELAVTISGIAKGRSDIALGNIVGSNIFNLALIMGVTALIMPVPVTPDVKFFLIPFMLGAGLLLALFMRTAWALVRWEGITFIGGYLLFLSLSIYRVL